MDPINIKIVELKKLPFKDIQNSSLMLEISGKTANTTLVNTLRRLVLNNIPTYAFTSDTITISENTSRFDNDEMRLRLSQITPFNIQVPIDLLDDKYWLNVNYSDKNREKHPNDKKLYEMYINAVNNTTEIMNVTTNDATFYEDGEENMSICGMHKDFPALLIKLKPKESFKSRSVAVLGLGLRNNIWAGAANAFYEEIDNNKFKLTLLSQGQMDEYELLHKGCIILKKELDNIKSIIGNRYKNSPLLKNNMIKIKLENKDHTIGNVINEYLQLNKNIGFSGLSKPDLLLNEIVLTIESLGSNPLNPLFETIDYVIKIFDNIQKQLREIGKKYIK